MKKIKNFILYFLISIFLIIEELSIFLFSFLYRKLLSSKIEYIRYYLNNKSVFFDTQYNPSPYTQGCKALLDGLLSISSTPRGIQFLADVKEQSNLNPTNPIYYIKFHPGDVLSLLIKYIPYNGNGESIIGSNLVYTRSYKIMLVCQ